MTIIRSQSAPINFVLVLASLLATFGCIEGVTRIYIHFHPQPPNNRYDLHLRQPPPYRGASYFSKEFVDESFAQPNGWITPPGTRLVIPGDFHGRFFNIDGGRRRTTGQPQRHRRRLLVFGGSTVYGAEVPDWQTLPSCLQRLLNARQPDTWRVENLGTFAANTGQQLELLKTLEILPGDVVVFYDGVNDVVEGVFNGDPDGWIIGANRKSIHASGFLKSLLIRTNAKLLASRAQNYSYFLKYAVGDLVNGGNCRMKDHLRDSARVDALARATAQVFRRNILEAEAYVKRRGGTFVHFLQPNLYIQPHWSDYERDILRDCYINPAGLDVAFRAAYPKLRNVSGNTVPAEDLTQVLWQRSSGEEFYLDYCHVNDAANRRIAERILRSAQMSATDPSANVKCCRVTGL